MLDEQTSDILSHPYKYSFLQFARARSVGLPESVANAWDEWVQSCKDQYALTSSFEGMSSSAIQLLTGDDTTDASLLTVRAISQMKP